MLAGETGKGSGIVGTLGIVPNPGTCSAAFTLPTCKPASCKASVTLPRGCPTKLGITKAGGCAVPVTSKLILGAEIPLALGGGLCATT